MNILYNLLIVMHSSDNEKILYLKETENNPKMNLHPGDNNMEYTTENLPHMT